MQSAPPLKDRMLGLEEMAIKLGVTTRHVQNLVRDGRVPPPRRLGSRILWPESEIDRWIADGCPAVAPNKGLKGEEPCADNNTG